jgi:hypothetical protein
VYLDEPARESLYLALGYWFGAGLALVKHMYVSNFNKHVEPFEAENIPHLPRHLLTFDIDM